MAEAYHISGKATLDTSPAEAKLSRFVKKAENTTIKLGSIDHRKFTQPLGRITGSVTEFHKSLEASHARVLAFTASAGILYGVTRAFREMARAAVEVEKTLADINVILGATSGNLERFGKELFNVAKGTGQSFYEVSKAATEFSRQGLSMEKTIIRTRDALILMRLSGMDAESAVNSLTATINSFNQAALTSTVIINKLANVDAAFAVSSQDLAEAIRRVASTASDVNVSFDELIATVTAAQQVTARGGNVIGNSLKTIFTRIQRTEVMSQLESLGVTVRKVSGEMRPAMVILKDLAKIYGNLSGIQQSYTAELTAGVYQMNIFKALIKDLAKDQSIYNQALQTSVDTTDEAIRRNAELNKTMSALINESLQNLEAFGASVGKVTFEPMLKRLLGAFNGLGKEISWYGDIRKMLGMDEKKAGGFGKKMAKGIMESVGNFFSGPGLVLMGTVIIKLLGDFTKFLSKATVDFVGMNKSAHAQAAVQKQISMFLRENPQLIELIVSGEKTQLQVERQILDIIKGQVKEKQNLANISSKAARDLMSMGVGVKIDKGAGTSKLTYSGKGGAAEGFIPNFKDMGEYFGALQGGYQPGAQRKMYIPHEGNVTWNTAETVARFPGIKQPAIMPPSGSKAGKSYDGDFSSQWGFSPYAAAEAMGQMGSGDGAAAASRGFLPNFAGAIHVPKSQVKGRPRDIGSVATMLVPQKQSSVTQPRPFTYNGAKYTVPVRGYGSRKMKSGKGFESLHADVKASLTRVAKKYASALDPPLNKKIKPAKYYNQGAIASATGTVFESAIDAAFGRNIDKNTARWDVKGGTKGVGLVRELFGYKTKHADYKNSMTQGNLQSMAKKFEKERLGPKGASKAEGHIPNLMGIFTSMGLATQGPIKNINNRQKVLSIKGSTLTKGLPPALREVMQYVLKPGEMVRMSLGGGVNTLSSKERDMLPTRKGKLTGKWATQLGAAQERLFRSRAGYGSPLTRRAGFKGQEPNLPYDIRGPRSPLESKTLEFRNRGGGVPTRGRLRSGDIISLFQKTLYENNSHSRRQIEKRLNASGNTSLMDRFRGYLGQHTALREKEIKSFSATGPQTLESLNASMGFAAPGPRRASGGFIPNFRNVYDWDETLGRARPGANMFSGSSIAGAKPTGLAKGLMGSQKPIMVLTARDIRSLRPIRKKLKKWGIPYDKVTGTGSMFNDLKISTDGLGKIVRNPSRRGRMKGHRNLTSAEKKALLLQRIQKKFGGKFNLIDDAVDNIKSIKNLFNPNVTGQLYSFRGQQAGRGALGKASGFVPNFSPLSRAMKTEKAMGGKPEFRSWPFPHVADSSTQSSWGDVVKSHPEGIKSAISNSMSAQAAVSGPAASRGYVPNFAEGDEASAATGTTGFDLSVITAGAAMFAMGMQGVKQEFDQIKETSKGLVTEQEAARVAFDEQNKAQKKLSAEARNLGKVEKEAAEAMEKTQTSIGDYDREIKEAEKAVAEATAKSKESSKESGQHKKEADLDVYDAEKKKESKSTPKAKRREGRKIDELKKGATIRQGLLDAQMAEDKKALTHKKEAVKNLKKNTRLAQKSLLLQNKATAEAKTLLTEAQKQKKLQMEKTKALGQQVQQTKKMVAADKAANTGMKGMMDKVGKAAFAIQMAVPMIAGAARGLVSEDNQRGRAAITGVEQTVQFGAMGAMFGTAGAVGGTLLGGLMGLKHYMDEAGNAVPDLTKNLEKAKETFVKFSNASQKYLSAMESYDKGLMDEDIGEAEMVARSDAIEDAFMDLPDHLIDKFGKIKGDAESTRKFFAEATKEMKRQETMARNMLIMGQHMQQQASGMSRYSQNRETGGLASSATSGVMWASIASLIAAGVGMALIGAGVIAAPVTGGISLGAVAAGSAIVAGGAGALNYSGALSDKKAPKAAMFTDDIAGKGRRKTFTDMMMADFNRDLIDDRKDDFNEDSVKAWARLQVLAKRVGPTAEGSEVMEFHQIMKDLKMDETFKGMFDEMNNGLNLHKIKSKDGAKAIKDYAKALGLQNKKLEKAVALTILKTDLADNEANFRKNLGAINEKLKILNTTLATNIAIETARIDTLNKIKLGRDQFRLDLGGMMATKGFEAGKPFMGAVETKRAETDLKVQQIRSKEISKMRDAIYKGAKDVFDITNKQMMDSSKKLEQIASKQVSTPDSARVLREIATNEALQAKLAPILVEHMQRLRTDPRSVEMSNDLIFRMSNAISTATGRTGLFAANLIASKLEKVQGELSNKLSLILDQSLKEEAILRAQSEIEEKILAANERMASFGGSNDFLSPGTFGLSSNIDKLRKSFDLIKLNLRDEGGKHIIGKLGIPGGQEEARAGGISMGRAAFSVLDNLINNMGLRSKDGTRLGPEAFGPLAGLAIQGREQDIKLQTMYMKRLTEYMVGPLDQLEKKQLKEAKDLANVQQQELNVRMGVLKDSGEFDTISGKREIEDRKAEIAQTLKEGKMSLKKTFDDATSKESLRRTAVEQVASQLKMKQLPDAIIQMNTGIQILADIIKSQGDNLEAKNRNAFKRAMMDLGLHKISDEFGDDMASTQNRAETWGDRHHSKEQSQLDRLDQGNMDTKLSVDDGFHNVNSVGFFDLYGGNQNGFDRVVSALNDIKALRQKAADEQKLRDLKEKLIKSGGMQSSFWDKAALGKPAPIHSQFSRAAFGGGGYKSVPFDKVNEKKPLRFQSGRKFDTGVDGGIEATGGDPLNMGDFATIKAWRDEKGVVHSPIMIDQERVLWLAMQESHHNLAKDKNMAWEALTRWAVVKRKDYNKEKLNKAEKRLLELYPDIKSIFPEMGSRVLDMNADMSTVSGGGLASGGGVDANNFGMFRNHQNKNPIEIDKLLGIKRVGERGGKLNVNRTVLQQMQQSNVFGGSWARNADGAYSGNQSQQRAWNMYATPSDLRWTGKKGNLAMRHAGGGERGDRRWGKGFPAGPNPLDPDWNNDPSTMSWRNYELYGDMMRSKPERSRQGNQFTNPGNSITALPLQGIEYARNFQNLLDFFTTSGILDPTATRKGQYDKNTGAMDPSGKRNVLVNPAQGERFANLLMGLQSANIDPSAPGAAGSWLSPNLGGDFTGSGATSMKDLFAKIKAGGGKRDIAPKLFDAVKKNIDELQEQIDMKFLGTVDDRTRQLMVHMAKTFDKIRPPNVTTIREGKSTTANAFPRMARDVQSAMKVTQDFMPSLLSFLNSSTKEGNAALHEIIKTGIVETKKLRKAAANQPATGAGAGRNRHREYQQRLEDRFQHLVFLQGMLTRTGPSGTSKMGGLMEGFSPSQRFKGPQIFKGKISNEETKKRSYQIGDMPRVTGSMLGAQGGWWDSKDAKSKVTFKGKGDKVREGISGDQFMQWMFKALKDGKKFEIVLPADSPIVQAAKNMPGGIPTYKTREDSIGRRQHDSTQTYGGELGVKQVGGTFVRPDIQYIMEFGEKHLKLTEALRSAADFIPIVEIGIWTDNMKEFNGIMEKEGHLLEKGWETSRQELKSLANAMGVNVSEMPAIITEWKKIKARQIELAKSLKEQLQEDVKLARMLVPENAKRTATPGGSYQPMADWWPGALPFDRPGYSGTYDQLNQYRDTKAMEPFSLAKSLAQPGIEVDQRARLAAWREISLLQGGARRENIELRPAGEGGAFDVGAKLLENAGVKREIFSGRGDPRLVLKESGRRVPQVLENADRAMGVFNRMLPKVEELRKQFAATEGVSPMDLWEGDPSTVLREFFSANERGEADLGDLAGQGLAEGLPEFIGKMQELGLLTEGMSFKEFGKELDVVLGQAKTFADFNKALASYTSKAITAEKKVQMLMRYTEEIGKRTKDSAEKQALVDSMRARLLEGHAADMQKALNAKIKLAALEEQFDNADTTMFKGEKMAKRRKLTQDRIRGGYYDFFDDTFQDIMHSWEYNSAEMAKDADAALFQMATSFRTGIADAFYAGISGAKTMKEAFSDVFQALADMAAKTIIQMAVDAMLGGVSNMFKDNANRAAPDDMASGGLVQGFAGGGRVVGGSGVRDDVPAMLSRGEYVVRKGAVDKVGVNMMEDLNAKKFAGGGSATAALALTAAGIFLSKPEKSDAQKKRTEEYRLALVKHQELMNKAKAMGRKPGTEETDPQWRPAGGDVLGWNDSHGVTAKTNLRNNFLYDDPMWPSLKKSRNDIDQRLSSFALTDPDSPLNSRRIQKQEALVSFTSGRQDEIMAYYKDVKAYEDKKKAMQKRAWTMFGLGLMLSEMFPTKGQGPMFTTDMDKNAGGQMIDAAKNFPKNAGNFLKNLPDTVADTVGIPFDFAARAGDILTGGIRKAGRWGVQAASSSWHWLAGSRDEFGAPGQQGSLQEWQTRRGLGPPGGGKLPGSVRDRGFNRGHPGGGRESAMMTYEEWLNLFGGRGPHGYASGGMAGGRDNIPALLMGGEYVMNSNSVQKFGVPFMDKLNRGQLNFAEGGYVGEATDRPIGEEGGSLGSSVNNITINVNISQDGTVSEASAGGGQMGPEQGKQLAGMIKQQVITTIVEQRRQGGLLSDVGKYRSSTGR